MIQGIRGIHKIQQIQEFYKEKTELKKQPGKLFRFVEGVLFVIVGGFGVFGNLFSLFVLSLRQVHFKHSSILESDLFRSSFHVS